MKSRFWLTVRAYLALFRRAGGTVLFCVHGAQRAFGEQAECTQNKTEPAALAAATGNRKGAVAPLQCQGVWGRNAPNNTPDSLNRTPALLWKFAFFVVEFWRQNVVRPGCWHLQQIGRVIGVSLHSFDNRLHCKDYQSFMR